MAVAGEDAAASLRAKLEPLAALSGRFEQRLFDAGDGEAGDGEAGDGEAGEGAAGDELERSAGHFALLRPGYFRWAIEEPERQLLVAADGHLWHHDIELETAVRQPLHAGAAGPLSILTGDGAALAAHYHIERIESGDHSATGGHSEANNRAAANGEQRWTLTPRQESPDFRRLTIVFNGNRPTRLELVNALDRTAVVRLLDLDLNPSLGPGDFHFTPPPGVDTYLTPD